MTSELTYEFSSVHSKDGKVSKLNTDHANPVFIQSLSVGRSALLVYMDKPELALSTSKVEDIFIFGNSIRITTQNSIYWLKPYIREVNEDEE